MKKQTLKVPVDSRVWLAAVTLFIAMAIQFQLEAQNTRYKFIDLGTFGGPNSFTPEGSPFLNQGTVGARIISDRGTITGLADTPAQDPFCYFSNDCYFEETFHWRDGRLTNLGALPGGKGSSSNWMSGNGLVAGFSQNGQMDPLIGFPFPVAHAVLWRNGVIADLGTLPGGYVSFAWSVNNRGQVVGFSTNGTPDPYSYYYFGFGGLTGGTQARAFLWDKQNGMQDLGTLGGPDAWASLVNERGQVAGFSYTNSTTNANNGACIAGVPAQDPFFWEKDTGIIDIGGFGGTCGQPNAINERGQVVGQSFTAGNAAARAFLWDKNGTPQLLDLGTLGGDNADGMWINAPGDVVGYADLPVPPQGCSGLTCVHHAVLWRLGAITDLGSIDGDPCSRALSINAYRQIVGFTAAVCGGSPTHAFLWENGGPAVDFTTLIPAGAGMSAMEPIYINDLGEIAGFGVLPDGSTHAFAMIPCETGDDRCLGGDASSESSHADRPPMVHPPTFEKEGRPRFFGRR